MIKWTKVETFCGWCGVDIVWCGVVRFSLINAVKCNAMHVMQYGVV